MHRKSISKFFAVLIGTLALLGAYQHEAHARTQPATSGTSSFGWQRANFNLTAFGVVLSTGSGSWSVPLLLDAPGAKTIRVRGKVNAGSGMTCLAFTVGSNGGLLGSTPGAPFTANGLSTTVTLNLSSALVPAGAHASVVCTMSGKDAALLGVDYNP
jgi:hypothetical protein